MMDEPKCSECPNATHGFDRQASHNAGRYVCECESHVCGAEQLRQRVAELEKENSIERNLRIGVEAGFDCANEELGRLKSRIENLMLDSEQWRTDCQTYCDAMHKREAAITSLQAERDRLSELCDKWNFECDEMREDNERLANVANALKQQRDELVAALSIAEPVMDAHAGPSRLADFRSAIASVKEK